MDIIKSKRNPSLDIIRIIATLGVVMIHCCASFVLNFKPHTIEFVVGNLWDSISQISVPLFIMISGALFLDERKEITLKGILSKNVKNIAVATIFWALFYAIMYSVVMPLIGGQAIHIRSLISGIFMGHYHMWYLYMMIGLYLITPFLKKFVCKENKNMVLFFIILSFAAQFLLPAIDSICTQHLGSGFIGKWIDKFHLNFFDGYITYFLIGWYLVHIGIKQKYLQYILYSLGLISFIGMFLYVHFTGDHDTVYDTFSVPILIYSVSVFTALNNIKFNLKEKTVKRLATLSNLTFGVYLIHWIILSTLYKLFPYRSHCTLYIFANFAVVVCSSFLCSYIISKIPLLKKTIRA